MKIHGKYLLAGGFVLLLLAIILPGQKSFSMYSDFTNDLGVVEVGLVPNSYAYTITTSGNVVGSATNIYLEPNYPEQMLRIQQVGRYHPDCTNYGTGCISDSSVIARAEVKLYDSNSKLLWGKRVPITYKQMVDKSVFLFSGFTFKAIGAYTFDTQIEAGSFQYTDSSPGIKFLSWEAVQEAKTFSVGQATQPPEIVCTDWVQESIVVGGVVKTRVCNGEIQYATLCDADFIATSKYYPGVINAADLRVSAIKETCTKIGTTVVTSNVSKTSDTNTTNPSQQQPIQYTTSTAVDAQGRPILVEGQEEQGYSWYLYALAGAMILIGILLWRRR